MFIDTHCHLYDEKLIENIDQIIDEAKKANVGKIIIASCDVESSLKCIEIAKKYEEVYACVGFYPQYALDYDDKKEALIREMAKEEKVVGIGEIGLDYSYDVPRDVQKNVLLRQIKLASELSLPIVLHGRDTYGDLVEMLKANKNLLNGGGTFHCYTGSAELAREIIKLGLYISVGGVSTFQNAVKVKQMVEKVDLKNIILETDSPYLAPTPMRGKVNQPAYIPLIARNLADIKGVSLDVVEEQTTKNAKGLFKL